MEGYVWLVLAIFSNLILLKNCENLSAGSECQLPIELPKIKLIRAQIDNDVVDFQIDLESDPKVRIERDSLLWHASVEHEYMLLPVMDGVGGATVNHQLQQVSPDSNFIVTSHIRAPHRAHLTYSLLVKLKLPCTTIHMAIHQPNGNVQVPLDTGRIEAMPPPEVRNPDGSFQVEFVISTTEKKNTTEGILMGPLTSYNLSLFNQPWEGQVIESQRQIVHENGRWYEKTVSTISPEDSNALYEYDTNHAYAGGRIGVTFVIPLLVLKDVQTRPQVGFLTCDPREKLSSEKKNGKIILYQAFGQATCLKFDFFNVKDAIISMRKGACRGRRNAEYIDPVFGERGGFITNYGEHTYYLPKTRRWQYPDDAVCYEMRAVNGFGGKVLTFEVRFYTKTSISVMVHRESDDKATLTCSGQNGGERMSIKMYKGNLEDYYNPHNLIEDGEEAEAGWTYLRDTDLIISLKGNASPTSRSESYNMRLTSGHIASMKNNHESLFCVIKTKHAFLLEKFNLSTEHLGETIEI